VGRSVAHLTTVRIHPSADAKISETRANQFRHVKRGLGRRYQGCDTQRPTINNAACVSIPQTPIVPAGTEVHTVVNAITRQRSIPAWLRTPQNNANMIHASAHPALLPGGQ
jgi:hypothetical protein